MISLKLKKVKIGRKIILNKINLTIKDGQVLAVLGRNGTGKSTLLNAITKHPSTSYEGIVSLTDPVFMGFQKPVEIPELTTIQLLQYLQFLATGEQLSENEFFALHRGAMNELELTADMLSRPLNSEVSGGENKRIELLQMTVLQPKTLLLDEIDTGLDLDSQILIGTYLASFIKIYKPCVVIVTHNMKFLSYFNVSKAVVLADGSIAHEGGKPLIKEIDEKGFAKL